MKTNFLFLLLFFSLKSFSQYQEVEPRIQNEFMVMLKPAQNIENLLKEYPELKIKKALSERMNIWLLERNTITGAEDFLLTLKNNKQVKLAQFNHHVERRSLVPNDTFFNLQWNMLNTGQSGGTVGADIDATDAWGINHSNYTINGDSLVVAIVDVGFDHSHEDLNFFVNRHEIPDNGFDEDGNGYVDDYEGWNAYYGTGNIDSGGADPHSMHCSGIAGAIGNNGKGIAGVCWGVQILRVCASSNTESEVVAGYAYVTAMRADYNNFFGSKGAFIVSSSSSFGVDQGNPADYPIWCAMYDSMGAVGILSAAATANQNWNIDVMSDMPTACPSKWLITVTNTNRYDNKNSGAGYGKISIDLGAPGSSIYSTINNNNYGSMGGTSMATPHVAGTVAAMYAAACKPLIDAYYEYPDSISLLVKKYLLDGTEWNSALNNITVSNGRLNLLRAITNVRQFNCDSCNFSIYIQKAPIQCKGSDNGALLVGLDSGNIFNYSVTWSNLIHAPEILSLGPGFYSVSVRDSTGCQRFATAELHEPDSIIVNSIATNPSIGTNPGNIIINALAGNDTLWYSLDGINYQTGSTLIVPTNGTYTVYIKNESGCVVQITVVVSGIEELAIGNFQVTVFPNPANDVLNVQFNISKNTELTFSVLNVLGEKVLEEAKQVSSGVHTATMDIADLQSGVYFLNVGSVTKKFIILR